MSYYLNRFVSPSMIRVSKGNSIEIDGKKSAVSTPHHVVMYVFTSTKQKRVLNRKSTAPHHSAQHGRLRNPTQATTENEA